VDHFIYVIASSADGPVKLGISAKPERRINELQTGHANRLQIYHTEPVPGEKARLFERLLHRDIGFRRTVGEWFDISVADAVAHVQFTIIQYDGVDDLAGKIQRRRI